MWPMSSVALGQRDHENKRSDLSRLSEGASTQAATAAPRRPTVAGLFAGIGGIEEGFRLAGYATEMLCESDADARAVLKARFDLEAAPDVRGLSEIPDV